MQKLEFKQGDVICNENDPLNGLYFITKGSVETVFNGYTFHFGASDALGLVDLSLGKHSHTYVATSEVNIFSYPYEDQGTLEKLLRENKEVANLLINSMCRQVTEFLEYWAGLKKEADTAFEFINEAYSEYERLSKLYAFTPKKLPGIPETALASDTDPMDGWVYDYYTQIKSHDPAVIKHFFAKTGISLGFLFKSAADLAQIFESCNSYIKYLKEISTILLDTTGHDLFALVSELHFNAINIRGADGAVSPLISKMASLMNGMTYIKKEDFQERVGSYKKQIDEKRANATEQTIDISEGVKQNLTDSLSIILSYSGCPAEDCNKFTRQVSEFRSLHDKGSSDDVAYRLRRELTLGFYVIYQNVFMRSLTDPDLPTVVKMFLNFGYVDAALAGYDNADYLYSIVDSLKGDPELGVYTIVEWLMAIYQGHKEPSRNDFDEDFPAYVRELKIARKIDDKEETRLLADNNEKLKFEIENVFPIVNKITFGRVTTFCPVFSDYNVQRGLDVCLVTPTKLMDSLQEILAIDYSAYYRETMYSNSEIGIPKENIHVEVLPNFILMPNVGVRGAMWQEIEGRVRSTPARMFMPLFFLNDLKTLLINLTGEFRWEMCKRIQGPRWTELSDPSLTSEMFDYLQFYRNNRDLSTEAKVAIKTELVRAKNTYKTVFVSNYTEWLAYEANGSPRLNRFCRRIMLTYCPFTQPIREKLKTNPQFADIISRYELKVQQRLHHLDRVVQKVTQQGNAAPQEILDEMEYIVR